MEKKKIGGVSRKEEGEVKGLPSGSEGGKDSTFTSPDIRRGEGG